MLEEPPTKLYPPRLLKGEIQILTVFTLFTCQFLKEILTILLELSNCIHHKCPYLLKKYFQIFM